MRVFVGQLAVYFTFTNSINTQIFIIPSQQRLEAAAEEKQGYIYATIRNIHSYFPIPDHHQQHSKHGNPAPLFFLPDPVATDRSAPQAWALLNRPCARINALHQWTANLRSSRWEAGPMYRQVLDQHASTHLRG